MSAHPRPAMVATPEVAETAAAPQIEFVEERLTEQPSFATMQAAKASATPEQQVATQRDNLIASTFDQLVTPVIVPADEVPQGAVATVNTDGGTQTAVASAQVSLPMDSNGSTAALRPSVGSSRNAAAWAIESEVGAQRQSSSTANTALGYAAVPDDNAVRVNESSINVRSGPSQANRKLFALTSGAKVDVKGKSNGWVSITDERGREGWVDASLLDNLDLDRVAVLKDAPAAEPTNAEATRKVASSGVTVRSGPGKSNGQLFSLSGGSKVTVLEDSKGWLKIQDEEGRTGWAYKSYIR